MSESIDCSEHGAAKVAYVCNHVFKKMKLGEKSGFVWSRDEDDSINAYCNDCKQMLDSEFNGDWANVPSDRIDVSIYCETCATNAAHYNGVEAL